MNRLKSIALAFVFAIWSLPAYAVDVPGWANDLEAKWVDAFNAQDAVRLSNLYTKDARAGDSFGRKEIMTSYAAMWADEPKSCRHNGFDGFQIVGEVAVGWGISTCELTPKDGGPSSTYTSRWLNVFDRMGDGSWLISLDTSEPLEP